MRKKTVEKKAVDVDFEIGTGSVYEQIGVKNHREMETKADLVLEIAASIKKMGLTQLEAGKMLGISQPKLSSLLNGHFRGYSVERLISFLNEFGKNVDIIIRPGLRNQKGCVRVKRARVCC